MNKVFEVGKWYECSDNDFPPIYIKRRTDKTVWVELDGGSSWRMRVRQDENGNEFATDSSVPMRWRDVFTYSSKWESKSYNQQTELNFC